MVGIGVSVLVDTGNKVCSTLLVCLFLFDNSMISSLFLFNLTIPNIV